MPTVDARAAAYAAAAYGRRLLDEGRCLDREHVDRLIRASYGGSDRAIVELLNRQRREAEERDRYRR